MSSKNWLSLWWQSYKYRSVPWLSFNLSKRTARRVEGSVSDKVITDAEALGQVSAVAEALASTLSRPAAVSAATASEEDFQRALDGLRPYFEGEWTDYSNRLQKARQNSLENQARDAAAERQTWDLYERCLVPPAPSALHCRWALKVQECVLGYSVERCRSVVGGTGVYISRVTALETCKVPRGRVVGLYPGTLYLPQQQPVLLQSFNNPFIFRCIDGVLVDGSDKGLSKALFRSCVGRDLVGPSPVADTSWLGPHPLNPLNVGQYVNNQSKSHRSNVAYQELTVLTEHMSLEARAYLPNIWYKFGADAPLRLVALVTTRDVMEGEELFSDYFTIVS